jgi:hypothetical protein
MGQAAGEYLDNLRGVAEHSAKGAHSRINETKPEFTNPRGRSCPMSS